MAKKADHVERSPYIWNTEYTTCLPIMPQLQYVFAYYGIATLLLYILFHSYITYYSYASGCHFLQREKGETVHCTVCLYLLCHSYTTFLLIMTQIHYLFTYYATATFFFTCYPYTSDCHFFLQSGMARPSTVLSIYFFFFGTSSFWKWRYWLHGKR